MNELEKKEKYNNQTFEDIKHIDENGIEYWYARELQVVLSYKEWRKFENVINKAKESCKNSAISAFEHFVGVDKTIKMPKGATKNIKDYKLTRYACYLIAQNGDSKKKVVALAQTYFAIQTRKQEITEKEYIELTEDEKRFYQRNLTKKGNYSLNRKFDEFDILGFLIFIRNYIKQMSKTYVLIEDFAHLVAHRNRDRGKAMVDIETAINNNYAFLGNSSKIQNYNGINENDWKNEWINLGNEINIQFNDIIIREITLCIFSLTQESIYDNKKGKLIFPIQ